MTTMLKNTSLYELSEITPKQNKTTLAIIDNYPYILRCYVDADYISQSIRADPSKFANVTKELVHNMSSHIVGSTTDLQTLCEMYNMVFYGHMTVKTEVLNCFGDESLNEGGVWAVDEVCCVKFQLRFLAIMKEMGLLS